MRDRFNPEEVCFKAMKLLRENLYKIETVNILEARTQVCDYGDVVTYTLPRECYTYLPLKEKFFAKYTVKDGRMSWDFDKICEYYLEPAMEELAKAIAEANVSSVVFAPLFTIPDSTGAKSFVGTYSNVCLRCTMQYDGDAQGMKCTFDTLFATVDLDKCEVQVPKTPAIQCGRCEQPD